MTETTLGTQSTRSFNLSRIFSTLFRPGAAFGEMTTEARGTWITPMLVLSLTTVFAVVVSGYLKTQAAMMGEVQLPPDWQYWAPEMQQNYMQAQQATQGATFMYIIPLVGALTALWLGWVLVAALLHLGSTLLGGRGSMQSAFNIVAWGSLPFALRDILRILFMLLTRHTIVSPGLSGFVTSAGFVSKLLTRVDLFWIWYVMLLVIGFAIADGLPRNKAFVGVVVVLLLVLVAQAGLGSLTSGLGGQAVQRPFF